MVSEDQRHRGRRCIQRLAPGAKHQDGLAIHERPVAVINLVYGRAMEHPTIKQQVNELILTSLNVKYFSKSCKDGIETGNHYQSVTLGDMQTAGFRTGRQELLDKIDFEGKRVLDLGSNHGEISRAA